MGSTRSSSTRAQKMEYYLVLLILMSILGMLKVFCMKSDEGRLLAATTVVFIPKRVQYCQETHGNTDMYMEAS